MLPHRSFLFVAVTLSLLAQKPGGLPIRRVVLFKNGIGYIEHLGRVNGNQNVSISFSSGQLDDVLKSLTVLDLNGGRIGGVTFDSSAPAERQLAGLRLPVGDKPTLTEFLGALRGSRVEIRNGPAVLAGRLLSIERKARINANVTIEIDYISLLTDAGEVRTLELSPSFSVRLLDAGLPARVGRFLDVTALSHEPDLRRMSVAALGTGERSLFVSYISEVPVWKSTYRIVLSSKPGELPLLQGWAIIDNTVGQDWDNVRLSLVAGAPQSFVQRLSQPYYSRRPVVPLPEAAALTPQTFQSPLSTGPARLSGVVTDPAGAALSGASVTARLSSGVLLGQAVTDSSGRYEFAALPDGDSTLTVEMRGFRSSSATVSLQPGATARRDITLGIGSNAETITITADAPSLQTSTSSSPRSLGSGGALGGAGLGASRRVPDTAPAGAAGSFSDISNARAAAQAAAQAQALGEMFEYQITEPITLRKNQSALVPIVNARIGVEKVSIWQPFSPGSQPLLALWLHNNSGLSLDGGSFSVVESETFAGEGIVDPIRPNEKRLVSYAADLSLTTSSSHASETQRVSRLTLARGIITHFRELREKTSYTVRNADAHPRTLLIEHPLRPGFTLRAPAHADESTPFFFRFRLPVAAGQSASLTVEEARPIEARFEVAKCDAQQLVSFSSSGALPPELEKVLRKVIGDREKIGLIGERKSAIESRRNEIFDDQQRLRENIKSLKSTPEEKALLQRYTRRLDDQETELEKLKDGIGALEKELAEARAALDAYILSLALDVTL